MDPQPGHLPTRQKDATSAFRPSQDRGRDFLWISTPGYYEPKFDVGSATSRARRIREEVSRETGVSIEDMIGPSHGRRLVAARWRAIERIVREVPEWSLTQLARFMKRDHSTIVAGCKARGIQHGRAPKGFVTGCKPCNSSGRDLTLGEWGSARGY